ncbi:MAG TPA: hypothetical protein VF234_09815, partial [Limnochordia bacterium]
LPLSAGRSTLRLVGKLTQQHLALTESVEERASLTRRTVVEDTRNGKTQETSESIQDVDASSATYRGRGLGYDAGIELVSPIGPFLTLTGSLGYEQLLIPELVDAEGTAMSDAQGEPVQIDLSGIRADMALRLAF